MANIQINGSNLNPTSRYVQGGNTDVFPTRLGWWDRKVFTISDDDLILQIDAIYHQRPDRLAYDLYGKATYVWLVLQYNNILDVTTEFVQGKILYLPTPQRVLFEFQ
jgi:hypothetical protein